MAKKSFVSAPRPEKEPVRPEPDKALAFLARLAAVLTVVLNLPDLLDHVLRVLHEEAGFDSCSLALLTGPNADALVIRAASGLRKSFQDLIVPRGKGLHWAVMETEEPLLVSDMDNDPRVFKRDAGIRSGIYAPLKIHDRSIGVLSAHAGRLDAFTETDLHLLTVVARYLSGAIEVARLHEQLKYRLRHVAALRAIDMAINSSLDLRVTLNVLLDQVTSQLGIDASDVLLLNPHAQTFEYAAGRGFRTSVQHTHVRLGEGHAGQAALNGHLVIVPDLTEEPADLLRTPFLQNEEFIAYYAAPLIAKGQVKGVLEIFHRSPLTPDQDWLNFLEALAGQAAIAIDNATLFHDLRRSNLELALAYDTTLEGWSRALDLRDRETEGHSQRVAEMTVRLARAMSVPEADLIHVRRGALLHDIGKMGIPDGILLNPGPLTEEEWEIMHRHPIYAYNLLSPITYLRAALDIPYCHHEKWDGTGYPRGLRGEQIPLVARIFAVADVWDALRSDRPYRPAWSEERARQHIRDQAGTHFDPRVVEFFFQAQDAAPASV